MLLQSLQVSHEAVDFGYEGFYSAPACANPNFKFSGKSEGLTGIMKIRIDGDDGVVNWPAHVIWDHGIPPILGPHVTWFEFIWLDDGLYGKVWLSA